MKCIFMTICFLILTRLNLHLFQLNLYNENNRYLKYLKDHPKRLLSVLTLIPIILSMVSLNILSLISWILLTIFYIYQFIRTKKEEKIKLHYTSHLIRLFLSAILLFIFLIFSKDKNIFHIGFFTISFNFLYLYFIHLLNKPIDLLIHIYYKRKTIKIYHQFTNLEPIGITGSYGKTSTKNILNTILETKYSVCKTPKNYNTEYGLMITIQKYLKAYHQFFIAEMGAYKIGRIKNACDLVKPKYGILTTIGEAHLSTFKTKENIQKTKFELIESLPKNGVGILNYDDPWQRNYIGHSKCKIIKIGIQNKKVDVYAKNIKITNTHMTFEVNLKKETLFLETKLLGIPNVYNILSCVALADYLGLSKEEIELGVKKVKSVPHRLELKNIGNITLLDDAYNSNPVGAKMALDILECMKGEKIVITPGMIELGDLEDTKNEEFGRQIAKVANEVYLIGKEQTKSIKKGLEIELFPKEKIKIFNSMKEALIYAFQKQNKSRVILIENDLPDQY